LSDRHFFPAAIFGAIRVKSPAMASTPHGKPWLPWISVNHLHGIPGLKELDPVLFQKLTTGG